MYAIRSYYGNDRAGVDARLTFAAWLNGIRTSVSLLLSEGHSDARRYPLNMLHRESALVVARKHAEAVTGAILFQAAASSLISKEGFKAFTELVESLGGSRG